MNTKLKPIVAAMGLGLAVLAGPSSAVTLFSPITRFQDDNVDFIQHGTNAGNSATEFDVGDTLISIFEITDTSGIPTGGPAVVLPDELTGVAAITLTGFADLDGLGGANDMVFSPSAAGLGAITGTAMPAGAVAAMWLDSTPDLDVASAATNCASLADCITKATDGTVFQVDGFSAADGDDFWIALNAETNIASVLDTAASLTVAEANFGLSILDPGPNSYGLQACTGPFAALCSNPALDPGGGPIDNMIGVLGSGNIQGGQGLSAALIADGAFAHSDFDFQKSPAEIPEPATLALLGLGLLGMGAVRRRV